MAAWTWEEPPRVLQTPFLSDETDGPMVQLKDGSVVIPIDGRPKSGPPKQAGLLRSTDRGETWQWLSTKERTMSGRGDSG